MRKGHRVFLILFTAFFLLSGCSRLEASAPSVCRVVTGITVDFENRGLRANRNYTAAKKMQQVLNYLRIIDPYGSPEEDPENVEGSSFRITLSYSDGHQKVYLQKSDRFMKTDNGNWKKIDPDRALELGRILGRLESDPVRERVLP